MKIRNKLYLGAAISVALVIIVVVAAILSSNKVAQETEKQSLAMDINTAIVELDIVTYEYLFHYEERMKQQWSLKYNSTAEILETAAEVELTESIRADYISLGDLFSQVTTNYEERQKLIQEGVSPEKINAVTLLEERLVSQLLITSHSIFTDVSRLAEGAQTEATEAQRVATNLTLALMIVLAIAITTSSLLVARSISKPLTRLADYSRRVGEGEYTADIEITGKDEIASVAADVKTMVGQLLQMQEKLLESERLATLGQFSGNISHDNIFLCREVR